MSRKRVIIGTVAVIVVAAIIVSFFRGGDDEAAGDMDFSDVVAAARAGQVEKITDAASTNISVYLRGESQAHHSRVGPATDVVQALSAGGAKIGDDSSGGVRVSYGAPSAYGTWVAFIVSLSPLLLLPLVLYYAVRNATREGVKRGLASTDTSAVESGG